MAEQTELVELVCKIVNNNNSSMIQVQILFQIYNFQQMALILHSIHCLLATLFRCQMKWN